MKILLVTQWFDPEPIFKGLAFAKALVERGHEVEVVTGFPNYPGGKLYPGFRMRWLLRQTIDGVRVARVPLFPSHGDSALGRIANYVSFAASSLAYGLFGASRPDVIYAYHPPVTTAISAVAIGTLRRVPVVADVQDLWPDTLRATGMVRGGAILRVVSAVCRAVYRRCAHIVVQSPGFRDALVERGVPRDRVDVIYNWCDERALVAPQTTPDDASPVMDDRFNIVFAGTMGKAQALDVVIEAAALVADETPQLQVVFVGSGVETERLKAHAAAHRNVAFMPRMPMGAVGAVLARADALLVHLRDDPLFEITVPSKTQAYMAVGKPILMALRGDAARLVEAARCGVIAQPGDARSIADAMLALARLPPEELAAMGQRGGEFYRTELSIAVGTQRFIEVFERVIARSAQGDSATNDR